MNVKQVSNDMNNMKDKRETRFKNIELYDWIWIGILASEILIWFLVIWKRPYIMDPDAGKLYNHMAQIWKNKTLFLPDWMYVSTGEWDCASTIALLVYGITKNIITSFQVANICNIILFSAIILEFFHHLNYKIRYGCMTVAFLLLPYGWGMLDYANMLFFNGEQYIYKVLLPIWFIAIMNVPKTLRNKWWNHLQCVIFLLLVFLNASSSGAYVFITSIAVIMLCRIIRLIAEDEKQFYWLRIIFPTFLMTFLGVWLQKVKGISTKSSFVSMIQRDTFFDHMRDVVLEFLDILHVIPREEVSPFSPNGIGFVLKFILLILIVVWGGKNFSKVLGIQPLINTNDRMDSYYLQKQVQAELVTIFLVSVIIQFFTITSARYWLVGFICLALAAFMNIAGQMSLCETCKKVYLLISGGIVFYSLLLNTILWTQSYEYLNKPEMNYYKTIKQLANDSGSGTVVFVNNSGAAEEARGFDPDRIYINYAADYSSIQVYDTYFWQSENSRLTDKHLLVATEHGGLSLIPEKYHPYYQLVADFGEGWKVYFSEVNHFDGDVGLHGRSYGVDYPTSPGYEWVGDTFYSAEYTAEDSSYRISFPYDIRKEGYESFYHGSEQVGIIRLTYLDDGTLEEYPIWGNEKVIELEVPANKRAAFSIEMNDGCRIGFDKIEFVKM